MIRLKNVCKVYKSKGRKTKALNDININFNDRGFVLISGESGSGKTTLLNVIAGIIKPSSGSIQNGNISYDNLSITKMRDYRAKNIAFIYQEYNLIEELNIKDNLLLGTLLCNKNFSINAINEGLKTFNLTDTSNAFPNQLSGGQQQRVAIIRAILADSKIILADEPTGALDEKNAKEVFALLKEASKTKLVIVVSHDKSFATKYADRIIEIKEGQIVSDEKILVSNKDEIPIKEIIISKKNKRKDIYFLKLGFKYTNFKSLKMYLSMIILCMFFLFLNFTVSILSFNKDEVYKKGIGNVSSTVIEKYYYEDYFYSQRSFTEAEASYISKNYKYAKNVLEELPIFCTKTSSSILVSGLTSINQEDIKNFSFKLYGSLPKENEIVLTEYVAKELNIDLSNYFNYNVNLDGETYNVSAIIDTGHINIDKNATTSITEALVFLNENIINEKMKNMSINGILVDASSFSNNFKVEKEYKQENPGYKLEINNLVYSSIIRLDLFLNSMLNIGIVIAFIFIILAFLLLVSIVYSAITERKKDIQIIKMLGGNNRNIFKIFIIQPLLIMLVSFATSSIGYYFLENILNQFIKEEFSILIPVFSISFVDIFITSIVLLLVVILSTITPIFKTKEKN